MSWLAQLEHELRVRRVPRRARERILAEYREHLADAAADPARGACAELGDPRALAADLAHEAATRTAGWSVAAALAALAVTALVLAVTTLALSDSPAITAGRSTTVAIVAVVALFVGPQLALVSGGLAGLRVLRRRRAALLPAAELRLVRRRAGVALGAGAATAGGLVAYALDLSGPLPGWWVALTAGLAGCALVWLAAAALVLHAAARIVTAVPGPAGGLGDDLPALRALAVRPLALWGVTVALVGALATAGFALAEASALEGLERGLAEALALTACFVAVGRRVGVRR